ncbi:hypothetical protein MGU_10001 [Metarhizium guizhouense ARSEF 977]|uniref:Uncharacterized protein n=1 Tax=Metarhizium guizhouense (strain ARSEF 977) TaxID=1276136 RepID=A0A0B4GYT5_METGA|nr:hypothetical protein MGU_10001 [Metarhizium guizhouense ARSEF 977]
MYVAPSRPRALFVSVSSPQTPTGSSAYQVNVNRTKTKKWVEAKVQSYDGDDWGADEYDDEESEEDVPQPWSKPSARAAGTREATLPSLQTQQSSENWTPTSQPKSTTLTSPVVSGPSDSGFPHTEAEVMVPPRVVNTVHDVGNRVNHSEKANDDQALDLRGSEQVNPPSFVPSSDIYGRLGEANEKERRSPSSADARPDSIRRDETFHLGNRTEMSGRNADYDDRRTSLSPKLPDLARMSAFGTDFFSTSSVDLSKDEPASRHDTESGSLSNSSTTKAEVVPQASQPAVEVPAKEKTAVVEISTQEYDDKKTAKGELYQAESLPTIASPVYANTNDSEAAEIKTPASPTANAVPRKLSKDTIPVLHPSSDMDIIAPLRTPSPRGPALPAPETPETPPDAAGAPLAAAIKPTDHGSEVNFEPNRIQRETTFSTAASSPVKDNDVLSDEILKSLNPVGGSTQEFNRAPSHGSQSSSIQAGRDSSYTLRDYRSYWAATEDKAKSLESSASFPAIPELPDAQNEPASRSTASSADKATESVVSPQSPELRRRFSWEAENTSLAPTQQSPTDSQLSATQTRGIVVEQPAGDVKPEVDNKQLKHRPSDAAHVSPQVSSGSSGHSPRGQQAAVDESCPLSPVSDNAAAGAHANNGLSQAFEKPASSLVSAVTTADDQPVLALQTSPSATPPPVSPVSQQAQPQTMSFREIMSLNSSIERIAKYNETRDIFSSTDSGLATWLIYLKAQHPDISSSGPLFGAQGPRQAPQGASAANPVAGTQPNPAQQPYYQQYLNASSPTGSGSPPNRSRLGGLPIPSQVSGSTFGHSSNQIGTKSKEFMHSAGKMGKGLLSKGRSKLRGTGDKDEYLSESEAEQGRTKSKSKTKGKADRRSSWGLMLGSKPRPEEAAPQANANAASSSNSHLHATQQRATPDVASSSMAPQIPPVALAAPLSPLNPAAHSEYIPEWRSVAIDSATTHPAVALRQPVPPTQARSSHPSRATIGLRKLEIPKLPSLTSNGATTAPALSLPRASHGQPAGDDARGLHTAATERAGHEWAMISRDHGHQQIHQQPNSQQSQVSRVAPGIEQSSNRPIPPESEGEPKRSSSFIGLPPIRRSSTFGLTPKSKARRATDRFPIDDDDDDDDPSSHASIADAPANPPVPQVTNNHPADAITAPSQHIKDEKAGMDIPRSEAALDGPHSDVARRLQHPPQLQAPFAMGPKQQPQIKTETPQTQNPQSSRPWMHHTHRAPFSGQWKLEESRLSEPLNPVSKNRPGTAGSQQQIMYGFDKETGISFPEFNLPRPGQDQTHQPPQHPIPNPMAPPPPRQRSDVPPSSAQRWPELFAYPPDQRPGSNFRNSGQPYHPPYQKTLARDGCAMPRAQAGEFAIPGVVPADEDRGRKSRNSGLFKDLGQRIARAASRERRSSMDQRPATNDLRGDGASDSSIGTGELPEQGRRRPSFLFGRSGRASTDPDPRHHVWTGQEQSFQEEQPPSTPPPGGKRRSLLAGGRGGKLGPSRLSKSPSSNLEQVQGTSPTTQPTEGLSDTTPQKRRFSGISKVSNLLSRNKHENKPSLSELQPEVESLEPPVPAFKLLGRPSTANSAASSQERRADESPDRRGRRPSMSDLISGILGKRSASKAGEPIEAMDSQVLSQHHLSMHPQSADIREHRIAQPEQHERRYPHSPDQVIMPPRHVDAPGLLKGDDSQTEVLPAGNQAHIQPQSLRSPQSIPFQQRQSPAADQSKPRPPGMGNGQPQGVSGSDQPQRHYSPAAAGEPSHVPTQQHGSQQSMGFMGQSDGMQPPAMNIDPSIRFVRPSQPSPLGLVPRNFREQTEPDSASAVQSGQQIDGENPIEQREEPRLSSPVARSTEQQQAVSAESHPQPDREAHSPGHADGEIIRISTVSPDLSATSDWKAAEHHEDAHPNEDRKNDSIDLSDERDFTVVRQSKQPALEEISQREPPRRTDPVDKSVPVAPIVQQTVVSPQSSPQQSQTAGGPMISPGESQKLHVSQGPANENRQSPRQDTRTEQLHGLGLQMPHPGQQAGPQYSQYPVHAQQLQQIQPGQQQPQRMQQPYSGMPPQAGGPPGAPGPATQFGMPNHQYLIQQDPRFYSPQAQQTKAPQKESPGSRWKGLTKRMSEQMSQLGHHSTTQEKPEKTERPTGNKLLGAFKRNSKQSDTQQPGPIHGGATNHPTGQWQNAQQQPYQLYRGQQCIENLKQPGQHQPLDPSSIPMPPSQGHSFYAPAPVAVTPGHQAPRENPTQQARPQPESEPQYDYVPIPQGYAAVHGEGMVLPTAYNVGRQFPQMNLIQTQQHYGQHSPRMPHQPQSRQQPKQAASPLASQYSSPRRDSESSSGIVQSPSAPSVPSPDGQPRSTRLDNLRSNTASITPPVHLRDSPAVTASQSQEGDLPQPQPQRSSTRLSTPLINSNMPSNSPSDTGSVSQQSKSPTPQAESALRVEPTPETEDKATTCPANNNDLGVDIAKAKQHHDDDIYDATPRLAKAENDEEPKVHEISRKVSEDSLSEKSKSKEVPKTTTQFTAELEDTAGAHQRRVRLASQEEKIWLDPQDDPNYLPQMSATSYPGQEWNPYGDPDFLED